MKCFYKLSLIRANDNMTKKKKNREKAFWDTKTTLWWKSNDSQYNSVMKISNELMLHSTDIYFRNHWFIHTYMSQSQVLCPFICSFVWQNKLFSFKSKIGGIQLRGLERKIYNDLLCTMYFCNARTFLPWSRVMGATSFVDGDRQKIRPP